MGELGDEGGEARGHASLAQHGVVQLQDGEDDDRGHPAKSQEPSAKMQAPNTKRQAPRAKRHEWSGQERRDKRQAQFAIVPMGVHPARSNEGERGQHDPARSSHFVAKFVLGLTRFSSFHHTRAPRWQHERGDAHKINHHHLVGMLCLATHDANWRLLMGSRSWTMICVSGDRDCRCSWIVQARSTCQEPSAM